MPVLAAMALRPLTVRAASSSPSVVRMPSALSFDAVKAVMPSMLEIGYVMILDMKKGASGKSAEAWCSRNDLAHLIRSNSVAANSEKFTRDILNLIDSKASSHQPAAERTQALAHQAAETAALAGGRYRRFRAWNCIDQGLDGVGR